MKRRQLLRTGLAVTGIPTLANMAEAAPSNTSGGAPPLVLTRGHFEYVDQSPGRRTAFGLELTEGHSATGYETNGLVPGIDGECVTDLTVVVHGWNNTASAAREKVSHYATELHAAGYTGTVSGFSWDSDIGGPGAFDLAQKCAEKNGPKLARFLSEYRQACTNGVLRLVSHSLGAHVIMSALKTLAADSTWNAHGFTIDTVTLLGAAIDNEAPTPEWPQSYDAFTNEVGHTFNYHSWQDDALTAYNISEADQALGESGVESGNTPPENFTDIDVTDAVGDNHSGYMTALAPQVVTHMYQVAAPSSPSNPEPKPESNPAFSDSDQVVPTTALNTREQPGTDSLIIETMAPETVGEITNGPIEEDGYTWWGVHWLDADIWGWSVERYLAGSGESGGSGGSGFSDGERVTPTANLNTRYRPGAESRVLDTMAPGTVGEIMNGPETEDGYTWWGIHWLDADIWGWSAGQYLESTGSGGGDDGGGGGDGGGKPLVEYDQAASGNYEPANRTAGDIRWAIIHTIEGSYETGISVFNNPSSGVSAHYVVGNDTGQITQMVDDSDIAYTAGNYDYNATGLNFENEGFASQGHPDSLYQNAADIVSWVCEEYDIPKEHPNGVAPADPTAGSGVIGHNQVPDPENPSLGGGASNHTDPGEGWDWDYFMSLL